MPLLKDSQIAVLESLSNLITPLIFGKNLISDSCICDCTLSLITQRWLE